MPISQTRNNGVQLLCVTLMSLLRHQDWPFAKDLAFRVVIIRLFRVLGMCRLDCISHSDTLSHVNPHPLQVSQVANENLSVEQS